MQERRERFHVVLPEEVLLVKLEKGREHKSSFCLLSKLVEDVEGVRRRGASLRKECFYLCIIHQRQANVKRNFLFNSY